MPDQQKSMNYFFPQQMAQANQAVPLAPRMPTPTAPIPPEMFAPGPDGSYDHLENAVDEFTKGARMTPGQQFIVPYPSGPKTFQYLGPDSGGRKDWMEVNPRQPAQTS